MAAVGSFLTETRLSTSVLGSLFRMKWFFKEASCEMAKKSEERATSTVHVLQMMSMSSIHLLFQCTYGHVSTALR